MLSMFIVIIDVKGDVKKMQHVKLPFQLSITYSLTHNVRGVPKTTQLLQLTNVSRCSGKLSFNCFLRFLQLCFLYLRSTFAASVSLTIVLEQIRNVTGTKIKKQD